MIVSELIEKLGEFNPDAEVDVIAMNRKQDFSLSYILALDPYQRRSFPKQRRTDAGHSYISPAAFV